MGAKFVIVLLATECDIPLRVIDYIERWFWTATHSCDDQNTMQILVMSAGEMELKEFSCSGSFATIRFVMSVRLSLSPSSRMEQLGSH